jgi:hypothetical protein
MRYRKNSSWQAFGFIIGVAWPAAAVAQSGDCAPYDSAVIGGARIPLDFVPPVSDTLLTADKIETALPCLIVAVKNLKPEVSSPNFGQPARGKFNRATGAIQTIMANNQANPPVFSHIINVLRSNNSIDAVSVLTYGLRGPDHSSRLNALVILGNIIDNTTVCVPIDHLYDPVLVNSDDDLAWKWRANLLGVVAVPAPWANKENYNAISRVRQYWLRNIAEDPRFQSLSDVLENIGRRLATPSNPNRRETLKQAGLTSCLDYKPKWADAEAWMKDPSP